MNTRKTCCHKETAQCHEAVLFGLNFTNDIHYKLRCSQASIKQGRLQSSEHIGALCSSSMRCLVQPRCTGFIY